MDFLKNSQGKAKLVKVETTYTLTKKELEEILGIKISRIYCSDMGPHGTPSYDLTISTVENKK